MLEITRHIGRSTAVDEFLPRILDSLFEIFSQAERGYILLADKPGGRLSLRAVKQRREGGGSSLTMGPISRSVAMRVMQDGQAILSANKADENSSRQRPGRRRHAFTDVGPFDRTFGKAAGHHSHRNDRRGAAVFRRPIWMCW